MGAGDIADTVTLTQIISGRAEPHSRLTHVDRAVRSLRVFNYLHAAGEAV